MRLILLISLIFISSNQYCQKSPIKKITIIGVIHNGNNLINSDSLLNVLYKINPSIIFNESTFKQNTSFFADKVGLNNSIDVIAPYKYLIKYPETSEPARNRQCSAEIFDQPSAIFSTHADRHPK